MSHRGGLSGKARTVREKARDVRRFTDHLIAEYSEPGLFERSPVRHIRIGRRSEFLPSVGDADDGRALRASTAHATPALRFVPARGEGGVATAAAASASVGAPCMDVAGGVRDPAEIAPVGGEDTSSAPDTSAEAIPVIRTPRTGNSLPIFPAPARAGATFSVKRFCFGCAMGGGFAAVVLLALRALLY